MQQIPELEANLKWMAERWRCPAGLDPAAELGEHRRILAKHPQHLVRRALETIKATKTGREWPMPPEIVKLVEDAASASRRGASWQDLEAKWEDRWVEADKILAGLGRASQCPQILEAQQLGFWRQFKAVARRVLWERLRDGLDPERTPLLTYGHGVPTKSPGMYDHLKAKHLAEVEAASWQARHRAENGGKYRA